MKWDTDTFRKEKLLIMDSIVKFSEKFEGKDSSQISIKDLQCFIDEFFEKYFM